MIKPQRIPIKFQTLNEPVTFVLKDTEGIILDDKILPPCTGFNQALAELVFSGCSGIMRSSGTRYGVLELIGRDKKVRQSISFDIEQFREWRDAQEVFLAKKAGK